MKLYGCVGVLVALLFFVRTFWSFGNQGYLVQVWDPYEQPTFLRYLGVWGINIAYRLVLVIGAGLFWPYTLFRALYIDYRYY